MKNISKYQRKTTDVFCARRTYAFSAFPAQILAWVYWLQILDKSVLGYAATFGLKTAAHLHGNKYSTLGSMNAIAQLAWMPFSSYLLVPRPSPHPHVGDLQLLGHRSAAWPRAQSTPPWPHAVSCSASFRGSVSPPLRHSHLRYDDYPSHFAARLRYSTIHILGAVNPKIHVYQMIFLFCGLVCSSTLFNVLHLNSGARIDDPSATGPIVYWRLSNSVSEAALPPPEDRKRKLWNAWGQALEAVLEPKTWLFFAMVPLRQLRRLLPHLAAQHALRRLPDIVIFFASYAALPLQRWMKVPRHGPLLVLPVLAGLIISKLHRPNEGCLLVGYYLLVVPKSVVLAGYNAASSVGNIVARSCFRDTDAPLYRHGLPFVHRHLAALAGSILLQVVNFMILNHLKQRQRIARGKPAVLHDASMDNRFRQRTQSQLDREKLEAASTGVALGDNSLLDLTDWQNDEFVYVYEAH
ncbi:hypothetical protein C8R44DRAFT_877490 [Mycena epipterygia]|nr:hypothetical protein C8R44DRAFT_877490 [Mycena epipterygia]